MLYPVPERERERLVGGYRVEGGQLLAMHTDLTERQTF
jgi:hypothetical protein